MKFELLLGALLHVQDVVEGRLEFLRGLVDYRQWRDLHIDLPRFHLLQLQGQLFFLVDQSLILAF